MVEPVRVLHVDDEPGFVELTAELLPREDEGIEVETAGSAEEGLDRLEAGGIDCVVSDYDMPGTNGIEFLETVRERYDDLPFMLYTGKGSEAVASDAISAGVTDYLQKEGGTDQYALLANRIRNAVEARLARERSRRREREYRTLIESSPVPIVVVDDGFDILYLNASAAETIGLDDPDELVGTPALRFLYAEDEAAGVERVERVFAEGKPVEAREYRIVTPEEEVRHVRGNVVPVTFEGEPAAQLVFTDVTEQREREAALKQERRRFSALFENFPEPTVAYGFEDDEPVVRFANGAFEETFGHDADEVAGASIDDLIVPPDRMPEARELDERVRAGELLDRELRRVAADGERYFHFRNIPCPGGESVDGFAVYTDVTERVEREQQLERQNERLDQFAGIVSHDLRNPLNVAMTRLELAAAETDSEHIAAAGDAVERIEAILDDTLELARHGGTVLETEPVDLRAVAEECWEMVVPETPRDGDSPTLEIADDVTLRANRGRLKQVFENLFRNSIEHGSGAQVGDRVESDPPGADAGGGTGQTRGGVTIRVGALADGIYVADDGPGIPEAERETVFDPGHSTAEDGTGFGLAIVREVVDAHGWEITVAGSETGGARFEITGIDRPESQQSV